MDQLLYQALGVGLSMSSWNLESIEVGFLMVLSIIVTWVLTMQIPKLPSKNLDN